MKVTFDHPLQLIAESIFEGLQARNEVFIVSMFTNDQPDLRASSEERTKYLWRYEGLVVLMWAAGYLDSLDRPDATCDIQKIVSPLSSRTAEQFGKEAKPRSTAEILDEADLIYRYQWATADARRRGLKMPAGLDRTVVQQRFDMFTWLVSPLNPP